MTRDIRVLKFDEDKRLAFGWAYIATDPEGNVITDRQGDFIDDPMELEKAAYKFVMESRVGGHMHRRTTEKDGEGRSIAVKAADIVESVVFTPEKIEKMGLSGKMPVGWWIGMKVHDDEVWKSVREGELGAFSIHGTGNREEVVMPDEILEERLREAVGLGKNMPGPSDVHVDTIMESRLDEKRKKKKKKGFVSAAELEEELEKHGGGKHDDKDHGRRRRHETLDAGVTVNLVDAPTYADLIALVKHMGPGPHPDGSPQSVHTRGATGRSGGAKGAKNVKMKKPKAKKPKKEREKLSGPMKVRPRFMAVGGAVRPIETTADLRHRLGLKKNLTERYPDETEEEFRRRMKRQKLRKELLSKHGDEHDEKSHGNWASGSGGTVAASSLSPGSKFTWGIRNSEWTVDRKMRGGKIKAYKDDWGQGSLTFRTFKDEQVKPAEGRGLSQGDAEAIARMRGDK